MKNTTYQDLYCQTENVITLVENCLPFIKEIDHISRQFEKINTQLKNLKKETEFLNPHSSHFLAFSVQKTPIELRIKQIKSQCHSLMLELEKSLMELASFNEKSHNLIVLKERIEAFQVQDIKALGLTLKTIDQSLKSSQDPTPQPFVHRLWLKVKSKFDNSFDQKSILYTSVIASLSIGWIVGYYSFSNINMTETNLTQQEQVGRPH